jgi:hypothetical protein
MDTGLAQVISSILVAIASIVAATITGYFTVRAAIIKAEGKKEVSSQTQYIQPVTSPAVRRPFWLYALGWGLICMPLAFAVAYTGNSLSGVPTYRLFGDSLDPALVSGMLGFVGFLLGNWLGSKELGTGRTILLFFIVGIFSAPVAFSLAYTGNWLDGVPDELLFLDSFDSLLVGALVCAISFLVGTFVSRGKIKAA